MKFQSIHSNQNKVSFREALFQGMAPDGGLYVPEHIPRLPENFLKNLATYSLNEIAEVVLSEFIDDIPREDLKNIIRKTFSFEIPLVSLKDNLYLLELFHGETLAFKDVGARFMAETLAYFLKNSHEKMTILVATSGDTGSAVGKGFLNAQNIQVFILYPKNKVSVLQEKQITTLGNNIHAIEVEGTFDDCQALVKRTLADPEIERKGYLSTANSINVGRLLPQIIYYFWGLAQLKKPADIVVPSGNFGNITACAYAKALGAPIDKIIAATNSNDVIPEFLKTGVLKPRASSVTLSNAMDVGNPNNFPRLQHLYQEKIRESLLGSSVTDEEILQQIKETYADSQYILDPHTAVGVCVAKRDRETPVIVAATAHPAKFPEVIKKALDIDIPLPEVLLEAMQKEKHSSLMPADYEIWKKFFLKNCHASML